MKKLLFILICIFLSPNSFGTCLIPIEKGVIESKVMKHGNSSSKIILNYPKEIEGWKLDFVALDTLGMAQGFSIWAPLESKDQGKNFSTNIISSNSQLSNIRIQFRYKDPKGGCWKRKFINADKNA